MESIHLFGAALGLGLTVIGAGLGIGRLAASAAEGIARQPDAADKITGAAKSGAPPSADCGSGGSGSKKACLAGDTPA